MIYSENILICITMPLLIALFFTKENTRRFLVAFLMGMLVCLLSAYISGFVNYLTGIGRDDMAVYYSPVIEEIMKLLPLLFYMFVLAADENRMYTASIGIGLGFATFENCCYILSAGSMNLTYVLVRGLAVGVMHLVCSLALILGLNLSRHFKVLSVAGVIGAISMPMIFHGLYNLLVSEEGVSSYFGYSLPLITALLLFVPFKRMRESAGN